MNPTGSAVSLSTCATHARTRSTCCAAVLSVLMMAAAGRASAQATPSWLAYTETSVWLTGSGCYQPGPAMDADCVIDGTYSIVTPWGPGPQWSWQPTWSPDGTQIAFIGGNDDIFVLKAAGGDPVRLTDWGRNQDPAWSPDGATIAFVNIGTIGAGREIYVLNPGLVRLTDNIALRVWGPVWSPDGARIAFSCQVELNNADLCAMNRDGTSVVRLTTNPASDSNPVWSPDSARIAFNCEVETNHDICVMNGDGTGLRRLTTDPAADSGPAWSPDGTSIAFSTDRFNGGVVLALMNTDGSGVSPIGTGIPGLGAVWSPDGSQIAFSSFGEPGQICAGYVCYPYTPSPIYTMNRDGTGVTRVADDGLGYVSMPARRPIATFRFACSGFTCSFDGSGSTDRYGTIIDYAWSFGDRGTSTGSTASHTFAAAGSYSVTLTVTDDRALHASTTVSVTVNAPPVAMFASTCIGLTCTFDGSGSSDSDGIIANYAWTFADGMKGSGAMVSNPR